MLQFTIHFATINTNIIIPLDITPNKFTIHFATINTLQEENTIKFLKIYNTLCYY